MEEERVIQNNPLVICAFGWGQIFRLYPNRLYARGRYYDLNELTQVHLVYQHIFGIPSARLELRFAHKLLILRGIAAIADAEKAAEYLKAWCGGEEPVTDYSAALASALTLPPTHLFQEGEVPSERRGLSGSSPGRGKAVSGYPHTSERSQGITPSIPSPDLKEVETSSADGSKEYRMSVSSTGGNLDVDRLEMIKTNISLPIVRVPVQLLPGEHAHYSTNVTLCGERTGSEQNARRDYASYYPAQDHGMLILTNRRMIYIGRNHQIVLDYNHLLHFSRLRTAVAFQADHWQKRVIFAVPQPIECSLYMEAILHRLQQSVSYQQEQVL